VTIRLTDHTSLFVLLFSLFAVCWLVHYPSEDRVWGCLVPTAAGALGLTWVHRESSFILKRQQFFGWIAVERMVVTRSPANCIYCRHIESWRAAQERRMINIIFSDGNSRTTSRKSWCSLLQDSVSWCTLAAHQSLAQPNNLCNQVLGGLDACDFGPSFSRTVFIWCNEWRRRYFYTLRLSMSTNAHYRRQWIERIGSLSIVSLLFPSSMRMLYACSSSSLSVSSLLHLLFI
jgi:hypothetical protein